MIATLDQLARAALRNAAGSERQPAGNGARGRSAVNTSAIGEGARGEWMLIGRSFPLWLGQAPRGLAAHGPYSTATPTQWQSSSARVDPVEIPPRKTEDIHRPQARP